MSARTRTKAGLQMSESPMRHSFGLGKPGMSDEAISYGLYARGTHHMEDENWNRALDYFDMALELQRKSLGENDEITGRTLQQIGICLMNSNARSQALTALEEALYICRRALGDGDPKVLDIAGDVWVVLHMTRRDLKGTRDQVMKSLTGAERRRKKGEIQSIIFQRALKAGGEPKVSAAYLDSAVTVTEEARDEHHSEDGNNSELGALTIRLADQHLIKATDSSSSFEEVNISNSPGFQELAPDQEVGGELLLSASSSLRE